MMENWDREHERIRKESQRRIHKREKYYIRQIPK